MSNIDESTTSGAAAFASRGGLPDAGGHRRPGDRQPVRPVGPGRGAGPQSQGQGQGGDPDLDVGRAAAHRHLRPQTGRGLRLLRSASTSPSPRTSPASASASCCPTLAKQADKYSIIRSMTHGIFAHETASYATQTGRMPGDRQVYPTAGAVVSLFRGYDAGYKGLVPPYIVLTEPQGRFSEAGFLGIRYKPFATGGDPSQNRFVVEGVVAQGISDQRQKIPPRTARRTQLARACRRRRPAAGEPARIGEAGLRPDPRRRRQGLRPDAGEGRAPRPLRPQQVRAVVPAGPAARRARRALYHDQLPRLGYAQGELPDHAAEAAARWTKACPACCRTLPTAACWRARSSGGAASSAASPRCDWDAPWNGGRNHWGKVFSAVVAGGGFKGGQVDRGLRRQGRGGQRPARLSLRRHPQHVRAVGHRHRSQVAAPAGTRRPRDPLAPPTAFLPADA